MSQTPIAERLFTWPSTSPQLIASQCSLCSAMTFPAQDTCPACGSIEVTDVPLGRTGTLWTWTTQSFPPISPPYLGKADRSTFETFGIGWVELPGELLIESRLTESDPEKLRFGMPVELVIVPLYDEPNGDEVLSFAFAPAEEDI